MKHVAWQAALVGLVLGMAACKVTGAGFGGLECRGGECVDDYSCDEDTNTCVTTGDSCDREDRISPCAFGTASCAGGCRTCTRGEWTECEVLVPGNECEPSGVVCAASGELVTCNANGFIESSVACGGFGCNDLVAPHRCNECVAGRTTCDQFVLVVCDSVGRVTSSEDCEKNSRCVGAGVCDAAAGRCVTVALAPVGTSCDEGPGADGNFCNSTCDASGACVASGPPSCDDGNDCTGPDTCVPSVGCRNPLVATGTACGDLCTNTCDAGGACIGPAFVCDDGNVCTSDACIPGTGCEPTNNTLPCDDADPCTTVDICDTGICIGTVEDDCDDSNPCTRDSCTAGIGCQNPPVDCSSTETDCVEARSCLPTGADGNCDVGGSNQNEGRACDDCPSGDCDVCDFGRCIDLSACNGAGFSPACAADADCPSEANCTTDTCTQATCAGSRLEHQACADTASGDTWGPGNPCDSVNCLEETDDDSNQAIGEDCLARTDDASQTAHITYVFTTGSPSGTLFNIWMRNLAEADNEPGEEYLCSLSGVTGLGGDYSFGFLLADLQAGRYGPGCPGFGILNNDYCWMAVDGDSDPATFDPIPLDIGSHTLDCTITFASGGNSEVGGYDGIIFTAVLGYVPDENDGPGACANEDTDFTEGLCIGNNYGPNQAFAAGQCTNNTPDQERVVCNDCSAGPGNCSLCVAGTCQGVGICDGATESCQNRLACVGLNGGCSVTSGGCQRADCVGPAGEHQACADTAVGTSWGPGNACESVRCVREDTNSGDDRIGLDCYSESRSAGAVTTIVYKFNTASPSGTAFNIWMRNGPDRNRDAGEDYECTITGVTGVGTYSFVYLRADVDDGRHGPGCVGANNDDGKYCWMAVDGNTDPTRWDPLRLDQGLHNLTCTIRTDRDNGDETAGYDGIIFTTNLGFIPQEQTGACNGRDDWFTQGNCVNNWGPNRVLSAAFCGVVDLSDGSECTAGGDTCCGGVCITGSCP